MTTPKAKVFFDSSALFAGVVSAAGAARALLLLSEAGVLVQVIVSEQVIAETERNVARKLPRALPYYREALRSGAMTIVKNPTREEVTQHQGIIAHKADVPIVVAAMKANADYLVTLNRRHFLDDPEVAQRSGLQIGSPGDCVAWVRSLAR
jgi:predicted nucleic acid-binding protein